MTRFAGSAFLDLLPWIVGAVVAVLAATFAAGRLTGKHSVIDTAWGLLFCAVAIVSFLGSAGHGDPARRVLLLFMALLWGLRLAVHIGRRSIGRPEDPRYLALLAKARGNPNLYALRMIYGLQGVLALIISAPLPVGAFEQAPIRPLAWVGVAVWAVGLTFEAIGDHQLEAFRRSPQHAPIMDRGLWRYTRHPNYFGDACLWWGIFLVAADGWPGVLTIPAPLLMTLLLTRGSGARILEAHLSSRPGWDDYVARTSGFVPLPPRR